MTSGIIAYVCTLFSEYLVRIFCARLWGRFCTYPPPRMGGSLMQCCRKSPRVPSRHSRALKCKPAERGPPFQSVRHALRHRLRQMQRKGAPPGLTSVTLRVQRRFNYPRGDPPRGMGHSGPAKGRTKNHDPWERGRGGFSKD